MKQIMVLFNSTRAHTQKLLKQDKEMQDVYEQFVKLKHNSYHTIVSKFLNLAQNCYGNYIIQEMLEQPPNC